MGHSTEQLGFIENTTKIDPHSATHRHHLVKGIDIRTFAEGQAISVQRVVDGESAGELIVTRKDGAFMQGRVMTEDDRKPQTIYGAVLYDASAKDGKSVKGISPADAARKFKQKFPRVRTFSITEQTDKENRGWYSSAMNLSGLITHDDEAIPGQYFDRWWRDVKNDGKAINPKTGEPLPETHLREDYPIEYRPGRISCEAQAHAARAEGGVTTPVSATA